MNIEMDFDIRTAADQVEQLFRSGRGAEAVERLEALGERQPRIVKEALDRFVASQAIEYLHSAEALQYGGRTAILERLAMVALDPRFPQSEEMAELASDAQRYDVYASIVVAKGSVPANEALERSERVILGLRNETSTSASGDPQVPGVAATDDLTTPHEDESRRGTGVYDDRLVVLWKSHGGTRNLVVAELASTEPSAQYDAHARPRPSRIGTPFAHVEWRRSEGQDVDGDGVADLGRLADGTFEMQAATHPNAPREGGTHFALRPSIHAVRNGAGALERDTNADGWFTEADINGRQDLNSTFKIHKGSRRNTDSAGCQTIHPDDYRDFTDAVTANPLQTRWQYVLTSTTPGVARDLRIGGEPAADPVSAPTRADPAGAARSPLPPAAPQPPAVHPLQEPGGGSDLLRDPREQAPVSMPRRPDDPRHPDHALLLQIRGIVRMREGGPEAGEEMAGERLSRALLVVARDNGMSSVDHLMAHGGKLFMVQGQLHDPGNLHASVDAGVAMRTGLEQSDRQLEEVNRRLVSGRAQRQEEYATLAQANEPLSLRM